MTLRQLTGRLDLCRTTPLRILVVEDSLGFAERLVRFLEEFGHEVVALVGVDEVVGDQFSGLLLDMENRETHSLRGFDIAFLDHYFLSRNYDGRILTELLVNHGAPKIVAMSSDEGANQRMMKAGATLSLRKSDLARLLGPV